MYNRQNSFCTEFSDFGYHPRSLFSQRGAPPSTFALFSPQMFCRKTFEGTHGTPLVLEPFSFHGFSVSGPLSSQATCLSISPFSVTYESFCPCQCLFYSASLFFLFHKPSPFPSLNKTVTLFT